MSNQNIVAAKPIYAMPEDDLDLRGDQNPNENNDGPESAAQNTQNVDNTATSDSEDLTLKKRYVDLKRHHDTSIHEARKRIAALEEQLSSAGTITPPKTAEEMEAFKTQNPDAYAAMETMIMSQTQSAIDPQRVAKLEAELIESKQRAAIERITAAHPDMMDIMSDSAFETWLTNQSPMVKSLVENNTTDADSFIRALDLYKLDTGVTSANNGTSFQKSNNDASAADAVVTAGASKADVGTHEGRIWTREEINKLTPKEFEIYEEEIDTAWAEGRVR